MKQKVIGLREQGKTYKEISELLNISKATINFHLKKTDLRGRLDRDNTLLSNEIISEIKEYYKEHTALECAIKFNISVPQVKYYGDKKRGFLSEEERKAKNYGHVKTYRQRAKERLVEYKGGKCEICDYNKYIGALDFHHLNPNEKDFTISQYQHLSYDKLKKEVDKCILVCSNCHREIHGGIIKL